MKNYKATGWNEQGAFNTFYISAENPIEALNVGKAHGLVNKINVKKSNVSDGYGAFEAQRVARLDEVAERIRLLY